MQKIKHVYPPLPQFLRALFATSGLGGLFFPVATLPVVLKQLAYVMPLTYADFALKDVMLKGFMLGDILPELAFLAAFAALMVTGAALSLRQERI